jgi:hypothetical protein
MNRPLFRQPTKSPIRVGQSMNYHPPVIRQSMTRRQMYTPGIGLKLGMEFGSSDGGGGPVLPDPTKESLLITDVGILFVTDTGAPIYSQNTP